MAKLPPEDQLEPTHTLGGDPTDEDIPAPELEDYDADAEQGLGDPLDIPTIAIPENEDIGVEAELEGEGD
ncbi:hypothetical protein [Nesterenkonia rhizosphaerae]|uniref:Sugar ABC transporter ATPase n=1 Tax=Nesterenkonia rhizosphaerae TaxID=1348272 RepID=A0ABP9FSY5_9MICC